MTANEHGRIRVLIVDDSSLIRTMYTRLLSSDPSIEVVGTATDPYVAREKIVALKPDVVTLDIEMPKMDGISFLEKLMTHFPIRVLVISSLSTRNSEYALRALELGAIDVMTKPAIDVTQSLQSMQKELVEKVKAVAQARLMKPNLLSRATRPGKNPVSGKTMSAGQSGAMGVALTKTTHQILAIASSTGGTEALKALLPNLPPDLPGTVIVQHMPPGFTKAFAQSLHSICPFEVKEAEEGDRVAPGRVLIAPGNYHMELRRSGALYTVHLHQQDPLHGVRPAADFLMKSVARYAGGNAVGVVLTGMGRDGAEGLLAMKNAGAHTIAQDEETCVVYGMPKAAEEIGAADRILPLPSIARYLIDEFNRREVRKIGA